MSNEFLILAIHTPVRAYTLKSILENSGIEVRLKKVEDETETESLYVMIRSADLSNALNIIEANRLFSYDDKFTHLTDDGRKRILVAVDFSKHSMKACQIAFSLAKDFNAKVKILHVYHSMYFPSQIPFADTLKETPEEGLLDKARRKMLDLCLDIDKKINSHEWPSVNYSYSLREGVVDEVTDSFTKEYKPSLVVMGTKGKDNNQTGMLGSIAADIIETIRVPVFAVPENSPINSLSDIKHIAFLTNTPKRDFSYFHPLVNVINKNPEVKITFVHINGIYGDKWGENEMVETCNSFNKLYPQVNAGYKLIDPTDVTLALDNFVKFIEEEKVNVISLAAQKRNLFSRMFLPGNSRKILFNIDTALFIMTKPHK
ncbi:hypothetical protein SDC9_119334 [bioreactor metagenome]|uniref:UspA domain-containing protein n=1 Tax=bioreactor metagenome TaxID=1076179 RepID=A0A645C5V2_9ZZZZ